MKKIFSILVVALFVGCMVAANSLAAEAKTSGSETKKSACEAKTVEAKSAEAIKPAEAVKPAEAIKPAEAVKPAEAIKPAEAVKPAEAKAVAAKPAEAPAAIDASLEIIEIAIAKSIENREPQEVADTFASDVERVYCYTKINGGKEGDSITHRWKKGDQVMAEISLKVNASPWRTYSSKAIMKEWTGAWTVEILQGDTVLKAKTFTIE
ncbi:DUF2914 domain-containing protein [bacterium]|nr:DUF2914 domain-containing protein [bacterium]